LSIEANFIIEGKEVKVLLEISKALASGPKVRLGAETGVGKMKVGTQARNPN